MTWVTDENQQRSFGPYSLVSERDGNQTAHLVTFGDGRQIRVLPDDASSGQKRSRVVKVALTVMAALTDRSMSPGVLVAGYDPMMYLVGSLAYAGLSWEQVTDDPTVKDFLIDWLSLMDGWYADNPESAAKSFVKDLSRSGWQIVKSE